MARRHIEVDVPVGERMRCPNCGGTGEDPDTMICVMCGGDGWLGEDPSFEDDGWVSWDKSTPEQE